MAKQWAAAMLAALVLAAVSAVAAPFLPPPAGHNPAAVDLATSVDLIDLKGALQPYQPPKGAPKDGTAWYVMTAANSSSRAVARVLKPGQLPSAGIRFTPARTRPEILQVATSDAAIGVEPANAYGRKSWRIIVPPATSAQVVFRVAGADKPPSLFAWNEPAIAAHNRQLAIFLATVAGLIGAAAAIMAGVAIMSRHAVPGYAALFLGLVLLIQLAATGMFDGSVATNVGGPYGLSAFLICLTFATGLVLADRIAPLRDGWPWGARNLKWAVRILIVVGATAFLGLPGTALLGDVATVVGSVAVAGYLFQRGHAGLQSARVVVPGASVFALVVLAAAIAALGGFGNNLMAPAIIGGFSAAGSVLLALAVAAGEGIAILLPLRSAHVRPAAATPLGHSAAPSQISGTFESAAASAIAASHQCVFDLDFAAERVLLSAEAGHLLDLPAERLSMPHADWCARLHPEDRTTYEQAFDDFRNSPGMAFRIEFRARGDSGRYPWLELRATMMGEGQRAARCLGLLADVTVRKESEAAIVENNLRDKLTGVGNRMAMMELLEGPEEFRDLIFALLDIDRFKAIHASLGDKDADLVLVELAERLTRRLKGVGEVFRVGGDSFAVVVNGGGKAAAIGTEIMEISNPPYSLGGRNVFAPVSVGLSSGADAEDPMDLIKNAELALLQAKRQGGGCARVFARDFAALAPRDSVSLDTDLRQALEKKQLDIYYQPIMRLSDNTIAGFEALLRWHHPVKGLISPSDFIEHSEASGLIVALGRFALQRAIGDLAKWQRFFPLDPPLFASVNLSRRQLRDVQFEDLLGGIIAKGEIQPATLKLEVTESAVATDPEARTMLERLRAMGAGLSIDDFGTGLSSLSQLKDLPFDTVKIDKSFLNRHGGTGEETDGSVILGSIVQMAHELRRQVIVEGVETEQDAAWLREIGCEFAQGYLFSPPLPAPEALNFIALHYDMAGRPKHPSPPAQSASRGDTAESSAASQRGQTA